MDATKIRPLGKRLLVKRCEAVQKVGTILLPEGSAEKPKEGEIVAVGSEQKELKAGDRVLFGAYAGVEVPSDEGDFLVMSNDDILAVVEHV
ncbi:MAG: co-chaperone GroES [Candidatus Algichlamydia australiensis]|nr:co-chaperone GroES [Chlamydiales bacterium]